jgi:hypothetical protein
MQKQDMGMTTVAGAFVVATVLLPWGFSLIGADRSIVIGSGMILLGTAAALYLIWGWTHLARRHVGVRLLLTLLVVLFVGGWTWKTVAKSMSTRTLVPAVEAQTPAASASSNPTTAPLPQIKLKKDIQRPSRKADTPAAQAQGVVGIVGLSNATVEMGGSSQIAGYKTGIQGEDHLHVVMKDQSRIDSNPNPLSPPADKQSSPNLSGPGLHNITIMIPTTDLPLIPIPVGTSFTSSTKDRMDVIDALVKEWRDSHPNWTVIGRNAIRWMNQTLEEQGKDFRVKMPEHCNPPLPGIAGMAVPSGFTKPLDAVTIKNADVGIIAGQNSKVGMNNTQVVAEENCD